MADLDIDSDGSYDNDLRSGACAALALKGGGEGCSCGGWCNAFVLCAEAGQSVSSSVLTVNKDYVGYFAGQCLMHNNTL